ncbi:MAG TPA: AraC family transcriptional regulator [Candidatus Angelobacter sp.]|jgi:AraC-like DNA-binding protein|nr:AraC family transcriptional regulator [Candidatus Angelobacter sp.]
MARRIPSTLLNDDTFRRLCRARDLLASEYQSNLQLEHAAREACLSPFHFHRLFRTAFGQTPHDFVTRIRMDRARHLLARGEMTVTEVCMDVGYSSLGSFSHKFLTLVGQTPSAYQRHIRRTFGYSGPWNIILVPVCFLSAFTAIE